MNPPVQSFKRRCFGFVLAVLGLSPTAVHASPLAYHVGAGAGAAKPLGGNLGFGPEFGVHLAADFSEMFEVRVDGAFSRHAWGDQGGHVTLSSAAGGVIYKLDVIRWVPYLGLQGGYSSLNPSGAAKAEPAWTGRALLGVDYVLSRSAAVGVQTRQSLYLTDADVDANFGVLLQFDYRFGW